MLPLKPLELHTHSRVSKTMLKPERITELATGKNVKRIAVENFLSTLGGLSYEDAVGNCSLDAKSYGWNLETYCALCEGIREHFKNTSA
jgi:hypothetical protein